MMHTSLHHRNPWFHRRRNPWFHQRVCVAAITQCRPAPFCFSLPCMYPALSNAYSTNSCERTRSSMNNSLRKCAAQRNCQVAVGKATTTTTLHHDPHQRSSMITTATYLPQLERAQRRDSEPESTCLSGMLQCHSTHNLQCLPPAACTRTFCDHTNIIAVRTPPRRRQTADAYCA